MPTDRKLAISRYRCRYDKNKDLTIQELTWDELVALLTTFKVTNERFEEYKDMDSLDKLAIKDVGYFVGGKFDPPQRKAQNLKYRSVLTLDLDHLESWDVDAIAEAYSRFAYCVHSSHSHSEEKPRLRIIFPFTRDVTPEEYEPIARLVAKRMGMDFFDDTTYQFSRVMFLPSRAVDGVEFAAENFGVWLDPDKILGGYKDWRDFGAWPQSSRELEKGGLRERHVKAADPFKIPGIIGAFNRAFPIDELIADERFGLPYSESGKGDDRYTYLDGTSADGAIFYPDDGHLFSHHESDPATGNNNAWDLVRLHKFGDFTDEEKENNVPVMKRASSKLMAAFAMGFDEVKEELDVKGEDEFDDLGELEVEHEGEKITVKKDKITFDSIELSIQELREDEHGGDFGARLKRIRSILAHIAAANLASDLEGVLVRLLQPLYPGAKPPAMKDITDTVKQLRKGMKGATADSDGNTIDIEQELIKHVIDTHFDGGKTIRYIGKAYWRFSEGRWAVEDDARIQHHLYDAIATLRIESPKKYRNLVAVVKEKNTTQLVGALKPMFAATVSQIHSSTEDPLGLNRRYDLPVFNLRNCEIHVDKDGKHQVRDHDPENFFDIRLDVNYDKEADAPEWDRFCDMLFGDSLEPEEMKRHLEEVLGYILQYSRWMKHFAIFMGYTDAGKSTIVDMLKTVLNSHYTEAPITMFSDEKRNQFTNMQLLHSLLLVDEERSKAGLLPDSALKSLAEEKPISTEMKFAGKLNFVSRVFPLIVSNQWPRTGDIGEAFTRRALVWHFKHELPAEKRSDAAKNAMLHNKAGFFNRCLAGLKRLRARGKFDVPYECQQAKDEWLEHCNPFLRYLSTAVKVDRRAAIKACVNPGALYSHWQRWCSSEEIKYSIKRQAFWEHMEQHGHGQHKSGGDRHVAGIVGLQDIDDDDF